MYWNLISWLGVNWEINQGKAQGLKKDKIRCTEYEASVIKLRLRWQLLERDGDPSFT